MADHKHLIVRADSISPLTKVFDAKQALISLVERIKMKLLDEYEQEPGQFVNPMASYCTMPGNRGLTAVALIETSSITLHVWDEVSPALVQLDVYSCAPFDPYDVAFWLNQTFGSTRVSYRLIDRNYDHLPCIDEGTIEYQNRS